MSNKWFGWLIAGSALLVATAIVVLPARGREFESLWARTSEQKSPRLSVHSMVCAATGPFSKGQTPVQLGLNCGGNVNTSKDTLSALAARLPSFSHMKKVLPGTILES
jgi:hypothetical protein